MLRLRYLLLFLLMLFISVVSVEAQETGIHYLSFYDLQFKFVDTSPDKGFIREFPMEDLADDPAIEQIEQISYKYGPYFNVQFTLPEGNSENIRFQYWVHTSISDAEYAVIGYLVITNQGFTNAIDSSRIGEIGDNCWYGSKNNKIIIFIRNNVKVFVEWNWDYDHQLDPDVTISLAKKIDSLLLNAQKTQTADSIAAPIINSVDTFYKRIRINAVDPNGLSLTYKINGSPMSGLKEESELYLGGYEPSPIKYG